MYIHRYQSRLPILALTMSCLLAACGGGSDGTVDVVAEKARRVQRSTSQQPTAPQPSASPSTLPQANAQPNTQTATTAPTPASADPLVQNAQALQVLVPAYFYPLPGSGWDSLATTAKTVPSVAITAILNPNNGPGSKVDAQYSKAIGSFVQAGGKIIGYVSTRYGNGGVSQATVRTHIDRYLAFYGRENIGGFFIDEMSNKSAQLGFYREVYDYIKGLDSKLQVVGNPGTLPVADYAQVADTLVTFEGQASAYARFNPQPSYGWVYDQPRQKQAMLVHDALDCRGMQSSLSTAATERSHTGWVYATDLQYDYANNIGDPWAKLPTYWDKLLLTVDAINKGSALPSC